MKRIVSLLIVACLLLAMVPSVGAAGQIGRIINSEGENLSNTTVVVAQGTQLQLYLGGFPENLMVVPDWLVSDSSVLSADGGKIVPIKPGRATVTAEYVLNSTTYSLSVNVVVPVNYFELTIGEAVAGAAAVDAISIPEDAPYGLSVNWLEGVDQNGCFVGGKIPQAQITLAPKTGYQSPIVPMEGTSGLYVGDDSVVKVSINGKTYTANQLYGEYYGEYNPYTAIDEPSLPYDFIYTFNSLADGEYISRVDIATQGEPAVNMSYGARHLGESVMQPLFLDQRLSAQWCDVYEVQSKGKDQDVTDDILAPKDNTNAVYKEGKTYRIVYAVETHAHNTWFTYDTEFYVNGQKCISESRRGDQVGYVYYYFTPPADACIQVMATMPAAGEPYDYAAIPKAVVKSENAIVSSTDIWALVSVGNLNDPTDDIRIFPDPETYSAQYSYCYKVSLMDENGDAFTVAPTVMINGKKCPVILQNGLAVAHYYFKAGDQKLIETVMVEGLKVPVVGQIPDQEVTVAGNSGYGVYRLYYDMTISWYDCTKDRMLAADETFLLGHEYQATVFVAAEEGANFDVYYNNGVHCYKTVGLVDGQQVDIAKMGGYPAEQYCALLVEFGMLERYAVNVMNGTAYDEYGNEITKASPGQIVTVSADKGWFGYAFAQWEMAENVEFADVNAATTTFVMPANPVDIYYSTVEAEPIKINQVRLTLAGFGSGADVTMLQPKTSAKGVYIYNANGDNYTLAVDKNGMPGTVVSSGKISASATYWLIVTLNAGSGYEFDSTVADNVILSGATKTLVGTTDASAVTVAFQLPRATIMRGNSVNVTNGVATVNDQVIGSASIGMQVQLIADNPPDGNSYFSRWEITGATAEDIYSDWTTFTMGSAAVTATAVYEEYIQNAEVFFEDLMPGMPVSFDPIVPGWAVYRVVEDPNEDYSFHGVVWWNIDDNTWLEPGDVFEAGKTYRAEFRLYCYNEYFFSDTDFVCEVNDEDARVSLEDGRTVSVTYEVTMPSSYPIKVNNGTVTDLEGNAVTMADPTQPLCLIAGDAPEGKMFAYWRVDKGSIGIADPKNPETTATMAFEPVEITAVYADPMEFDGYKYVLYADMTVDMELESDMYLDLNGHELWGRIITNGYKIYCFDSATDDYTYDKAGLFICVDEDDNIIAPERHVKTSSAMTDSSKRYLRIEEAGGGYSFHRFYLGVTHISIRPGTEGVGYKALFCGDDKVVAELDSYGYSLWLDGHQKVSATKRGDSFVSGEHVTMRVDNYDVENFAETPLHVSVTMTLKDGTVISGAEYSFTFRDMMEQVNDRAWGLNEAQRQALAEFIEAHPIIKNWDTQNLYS